MRVRFSPWAHIMTLFYDILILTGIISTVLPAVILLYHRSRSINSWEYKNKKKSLYLSIVFFFGAILLLYGTFVEPLLLVTNYQTIDLKNINKEIKIALVSDMHVGDFNTEKDIQKIADRILYLKPDLVFLVGYHILTDDKNDDRLKYLTPLKKVAKKIPTFAVNGNHDYGVGGNDEEINKRFHYPNRSAEVASAMRNLEIKYLINEAGKITVHDESFLLFGADEYLINAINFQNIDQKKQEYPDLPIIALIHNPAGIFLTPGHNIDLVLSGHTHGGQIRLPFIGNIMKIEIDIPRSWYQGWGEYQGARLFVTSGANESSTRARLFNPPEVVLLTIK